MNRQTTTPREFRVRKSLQRELIVCLVFYVLMTVGFAWGMAVDPPQNPAIPVPVITGLIVAFWGLLACAAAWGLLACRHPVLRIDDDGIMLQGVRSRRSVRLSEVSELRWRVVRWDVVIRTSARTSKIELLPFEPEERLWIIRFFRSRIDETRQTGWDQFCRAVANPIRQAVEEADRPLKADECLLTRRRIDRVVLVTTVLCLLFAGLMAAIFRKPAALLVPVVPAILGVLFRSSIPKEGVRDLKLEGDILRLFAILGLWTTAILTALALRLHWVAYIGTAGMTVWIVRQMIRDSRRKAQTDRDEIPRALQEWEARRGLP